MPHRRRAAGTAVTSSCSMTRRPASGVSKPANSRSTVVLPLPEGPSSARISPRATASESGPTRSEEHTSELQSHLNLVCRLLLEKKNKTPDLEKCLPPVCCPLSATNLRIIPSFNQVGKFIGVQLASCLAAGAQLRCSFMYETSTG